MRKWLNVLPKINHSMCFSSFIFTSIINVWASHLLYTPLAEKYDIETHLLCKYIVWYSLLICLCHIRLFHCINFSLYNFHWQNIEWCILVNVNIPLLQLLEILEKQRRCRWQSQSPLEYCETASQDKLSQHLYMHA